MTLRRERGGVAVMGGMMEEMEGLRGGKMEGMEG